LIIAFPYQFIGPALAGGRGCASLTAVLDTTFAAQATQATVLSPVRERFYEGGWRPGIKVLALPTHQHLEESHGEPPRCIQGRRF